MKLLLMFLGRRDFSQKNKIADICSTLAGH